jgi:hypothetical protein
VFPVVFSNFQHPVRIFGTGVVGTGVGFVVGIVVGTVVRREVGKTMGDSEASTYDIVPALISTDFFNDV